MELLDLIGVDRLQAELNSWFWWNPVKNLEGGRKKTEIKLSSLDTSALVQL